MYDDAIELPYAEAFACIGNLLLTPLRLMDDSVFDPSLWNVFGRFSDPKVDEHAGHCRDLLSQAAEDDDAAQMISVEYAKLFMGPPQPEAAPWQTFYSEGDSHVGYGKSAIEMVKLLHQYGLELSGDQNQYADHIGIELLLLSELFAREDANASDILQYMETYPAAWIDQLSLDAAKASPDGFYPELLALAESMIGVAKRSCSGRNVQV